MGCISFFGITDDDQLERVPFRNGSTREKGHCTVEVLDEHGTPEIRIDPGETAFEGYVARFEDWAQFKRFAEAVQSLYERHSSRG